MLAQQRLGPFDLARLDGIENGEVFPAGLLDAFRRQFLETRRFLQPAQIVLLTHRIGQEPVAGAGRKSFMK